MILHTILTIDNEQNTGLLSIRDIYKIDERLEMIYKEKYGQWDVKKGLKVYQPSIFRRRSNFHGHEFR